MLSIAWDAASENQLGGVIIRRKLLKQPMQLNVAYTFCLHSATASDSIEVTIQVQFQQYRGMIRRSSFSFVNGVLKVQLL
ncbi:MAG TPA: hypothetical protein VFQ47_07840 [Nitrososphaera sp.]|nr:hypothetical protein [Nitrososphaera sp.]